MKQNNNLKTKDMKRSNFLSVNATDFLKGLVMVIITSIVTGFYQLLTQGTILTWETIKPVLIAGVAAGLGYLIKNFLTNSQGEVFRTENSELVKYMNAKKPIAKFLLIGLLISGISATASAQLTFKGFFKPVKQTEFYTHFKGVSQEKAGGEMLWIVRPAVNIASMKYLKNSDTKKLEVSNYVASGFGLGIQHYIDSDGTPYNNYGFNLLCLVNTIPLTDGSQNAGVSVAGTFGFMKVIDVGIGYDFEVKKVFAMTGIKYNF